METQAESSLHWVHISESTFSHNAGCKSDSHHTLENKEHLRHKTLMISEKFNVSNKDIKLA